MITSDYIYFGNTNIKYEIFYSNRRKNISITVHPDKSVKLHVPYGTNPTKTQDVVRKKANWILKKIEKFNQIYFFDTTKEYVNGETFLYMGRQYKLKRKFSEHNESYAKMDSGKLIVTIPLNSKSYYEATKNAVWKWYQQHAENKMGEIIQNYSKKLNVAPPEYKIKYQKKRWGSCSKNDVIYLNIQIIMAPKKQIEYVVAHELCHLIHKNHSADFWRLLKLIMPDYKDRKEALRRNGCMYVL